VFPRAVAGRSRFAAPLELVTLNGTEPVTTSLAIAQGTENQHKNVLDLVRTYAKDLEEFGQVAFETRPGYNNCTVEFAILNEPHRFVPMALCTLGCSKIS
jgi:hypothetical protein